MVTVKYETQEKFHWSDKVSWSNNNNMWRQTKLTFIPKTERDLYVMDGHANTDWKKK